MAPGEAEEIEPIEIPDEIVLEWRALEKRLDEIQDYLHQKRIEQIDRAKAKP